MRRHQTLWSAATHGVARSIANADQPDHDASRHGQQRGAQPERRGEAMADEVSGRPDRALRDCRRPHVMKQRGRRARRRMRRRSRPTSGWRANRARWRPSPRWRTSRESSARAEPLSSASNRVANIARPVHAHQISRNSGARRRQLGDAVMFAQRLGDLRHRGDEHQIEEQLEPGHPAFGAGVGRRVQTESAKGSGVTPASMPAVWSGGRFRFVAATDGRGARRRMPRRRARPGRRRQRSIAVGRRRPSREPSTCR